MKTENAERAHILVPLDGTRSSTAAVPFALRLGELLKAPVRLLHVSEDARNPSPAELLQQVGLNAAELPGVVVETAHGAPADAIEEAAGRAPGMICLCARTHPDGPAEPIGPVAEELLRRVPTPLLLVRPGQESAGWNLSKILVPHDGSPATLAGLPPVTRLARAALAELLVLHVVETEATPGHAEPGSLTVPQYVDQPQHEWPAWGREFAERIQAHAGLPEGANLHLFLRRGQASQEIVRFAEERRVNLIALVWHGELDGSRAATFKEILAHAPCPVMTLRLPNA